MDDLNGHAGKGDSYRPVDQKKWDENWERIFGKKKGKKPRGQKKPKNKNSLPDDLGRVRARRRTKEEDKG
jgi:hypothetical protein